MTETAKELTVLNTLAQEALQVLARFGTWYYMCGDCQVEMHDSTGRHLILTIESSSSRRNIGDEGGRVSVLRASRKVRYPLRN